MQYLYSIYILKGQFTLIKQYIHTHYTPYASGFGGSDSIKNKTATSLCSNSPSYLDNLHTSLWTVVIGTAVEAFFNVMSPQKNRAMAGYH